MSKPACPCCNKDIDTRHTHMANLPATVICTGCGTWMRLDVRKSGSIILATLFIATMIAAWFWTAALILLPVYLVLSTSTMERFTITPVEKRHVNLWSINRDSGTRENVVETPGKKTGKGDKDDTVKAKTYSRTSVMHRISGRSQSHKREGGTAREALDKGVYVSGDQAAPHIPRGLPH
ncbi:hypothetical protein [Kordiimonas pumila]|uniref:Uncharacterized protein n=1 Tax=Kordiimonas pumila TaxID=2161677 RepID=A0ABV7D3M2_9PROT|nr:hypothetical protein [Kordiimonas pumila]